MGCVGRVDKDEKTERDRNQREHRRLGEHHPEAEHGTYDGNGPVVVLERRQWGRSPERKGARGVQPRRRGHHLQTAQGA